MILFLEHNSLSGTEFVSKCLLFLKNFIQAEISEPKFIVGKFGKPAFENMEIEFSCSHSNGVSAVLFSMSPCGVDIEKHRKVAFELLVNKYFADKEITNINHFFDEWCQHEAYSKRLGTPLAENLRKQKELCRNVPYMKGWSLAVSGDDGAPLIIFDLDILK